MGTCVYQDAEGNQLWEWIGRWEGDLDGGTGRFKGASGEITYGGRPSSARPGQGCSRART